MVAAAGYTYAGMGVFSVSSAGLLTLIAKGEQTSAWTLWNGTWTGPSNSSNHTQIACTSFTKQAGSTYAVGFLFVGTTAPQIPSNNGPQSTQQSGAVAGTPLGMMAATLTGQTTLGTVNTTTHTQASLSTSAYMFYAVLES
jgi:hypothetical protein